MSSGRHGPPARRCDGQHRNPEHVSRQFSRDVARCRDVLGLGDDELPVIRLHDLRNTHATVLPTAGAPPHIVSQRPGHASPVVTMTIYAHVLPGSQGDAANLFRAAGQGSQRVSGNSVAEPAMKVNYKLLTWESSASEGGVH
jgi:integrase